MSSRRITRRSPKDDWIIAIPSYKRAETIIKKTLSVLDRYNIPASKINIFVANKDEETVYKETIPASLYNKIIVGVPGLAQVRNFISNYYPVGTKIVEMDDDINGFVEYDASNKRHERPMKSLKNIIKQGFAAAEKHGACLWGVYPVANGYFMTDTISTDLRLAIGSFWGYINPGIKGTKGIKLEMGEKEDYIRTIKAYIRDGAVVRLNYVSPKTAYYTEPGGMQTDPDRMRKHKEAIDWLLKKYPEYVASAPERRLGFPEIRLKK